MKRPPFFYLVLVLILILAVAAATMCLAGCGGSGGQSDELTKKAQALVESISEGDFTTPVAGFDATMASVMPPEKLEEAWKALIAKAGAFNGMGATRKEKADKYDIVYVTCNFEQGPIDVKVVFDSAGKVAGLFFVPSASTTKWEPPAYADESKFTEREVTVGSGEWALPGTLTMPKGAGPFPAVVLVHGSGPNDRDETLGAIKPFKDLAWGLASQGVVVLRYEKRTKAHAEKMAPILNSITVREETIDDAIAGAALLRNTEGVDPKKVFVLGHSLGGMLIPRIAMADPQVHGLIVMAGAARPLEDLIVEQTEYIASLDGSVSEQEKAQIDAIKAGVAIVKDPGLTPETPSSQLPLGMPAAYWLDLRDYNPPEAAKAIDKPILVLQGTRDYQVTMEDFALWQKALSSKPNVTFETYPVNHAFVEGEGKSTPAEYQVAGHVSQAAVDDIANFVKTK